MEELTFSFDVENIDRTALLHDAARRIDSHRGVLGDAGAVPATPEGALVRDLLADQAAFAGFPDIHPITDQSFLSRGGPVPERFARMQETHRFYWCYFPIILFPRHNWAFNRIEVQIRMTASGGADRQPKAFQILPDARFQTLLSAEMGLEVRLNENLELQMKQVPLAAGPAGASAGIAAREAGRLGMAAGPFLYRLKKAQIQHSATGAERVFWRIDGAAFFQEDTPDLIVVLQLPTGVSGVTIDAGLRAYRYFNFAAAGLQQAVQALPEALKRFFTGGAPVWDTATYDISAAL